MQKIKPHLWYDKEAVEAANFYVSVFQKDSKITSKTILNDTPSGDVDLVSFRILGYEFMAMSAGPLFKFNPSISFLVSCETKSEVEEIWKKLVEGAKVLMPFDQYPFSEKYGWLEDKYGLSWQIMFNDKIDQKIIPTLMFTEKLCGKAGEAMNFYAKVFKDSKIGDSMKYQSNEEPDVAGTIKHADFTIENQSFSAMDSARVHDFSFNESISFIVSCETQDEIDYYWNLLSAVPESEQCGWLKDKYGVSWQITPTEMEKLMSDSDQNKINRVTEALLKMKKFDIGELRKAYEGS